MEVATEATPGRAATSTMTVADGVRVSLEYTLSLEGNVIESNDDGNPLEYVHGESRLIPGLERALEGMAVGEAKDVTIQPADGYGDVHAEAIQTVPRDQIPDHLRKVGAQLQAETPDGETLRAHVTEVSGDNVTVDFNHPLAGKVLQFSVKVVDLQPAESESRIILPE